MIFMGVCRIFQRMPLFGFSCIYLFLADDLKLSIPTSVSAARKGYRIWVTFRYLKKLDWV